MFWLVPIAGGVGVLFGLQIVRVHWVIVASAVAAVVGLAVAPLMHSSPLMTVVFMFSLVSALQCGYLGGILLSSARTRANAPHAILRSSHIDQWRT
jgi:hypothetical protein